MCDFEYSTETILPYKFESTYDTYCLRACMGIGKTKGLNELFNNGIYKKIVIISFRKTLDREYVNNFKDFELYLDINENENIYDLEKHNKIVIQIDSIHKLFGKCDLLVLDEYTYSCFHLVEFTKERKQCYDTLKEYVQKTKHIIVLDAYLNGYYLKWFKELGRKIYFVKNNYKKHIDKEIINYSNNIGPFIEAIIKYLKDNKKIVLCTNKRSFLEKIEDIVKNTIKNKEYKFINCDNSDDIDLNNWDKYDIVGYTPTIVAGISFEKRHFDACFGYFINSTSCAELSVQQLFRVRDLKENKFHICVETNGKKDFPTDRDSVRKYILERNSKLNDGINNLTLSHVDRDIIEDDYFTMFLNIQLLTFQSKNDYESKLLNLLKIQGVEKIKNIECNDIESKKYRKEIKELTKINKQKNYERMYELPKIQFDEYEDLKKNNRKTKDEKLQIMYYNLSTNFCCDNLTPDLISKYEKYVKVYNIIKYMYNIKDDINNNLCEKINDYESKLKEDCDNTKKLHCNDKYYKVAHLHKILNILGFESMFDKSEIIINKSDIIKHIKKYGHRLDLLFITKENKWENMDDDSIFKEVLKYINQRLRSVFKISIKSKNDNFYIDGLDFWCEKVNPMKNFDDILKDIINNLNSD
jgi:hypothetical protein